MSRNGDSDDKPRRQPTLADEYRRQHESLDRLLAAFLCDNPDKLPSTTTVMELAEWSHTRCQECGGEAKMNVRFDTGYCICECGTSMMYLDSLWDATQRRIACSNNSCAHHGEVYLEPVWRVELAPAAAQPADG